MTSTSEKYNMRLITVVMNEPSTQIRNGETSSMLDYGFNMYSVNKILDTENPVSFDITTDKPLSPPGAIVCGTKNIFSPTDIIIHAVISPMYSTKILL